MTSRFWLVAAAVLYLVGVVPVAAQTVGPPAVAELTAVLLRRADDGSTIVQLATTAAAAYRSEVLGSPPRIAVDLDGTLYRAAPRLPVADADPVREIRGSQFRRGVARVVIELTRAVPFVVEPMAGGIRIVLRTGGPPGTARGDTSLAASAPPAARSVPATPPASVGERSPAGGAAPSAPVVASRPSTSPPAPPAPAAPTPAPVASTPASTATGPAPAAGVPPPAPPTLREPEKAASLAPTPPVPAPAAASPPRAGVTPPSAGVAATPDAPVAAPETASATPSAPSVSASAAGPPAPVPPESSAGSPVAGLPDAGAPAPPAAGSSLALAIGAASAPGAPASVAPGQASPLVSAPAPTSPASRGSEPPVAAVTRAPVTAAVPPVPASPAPLQAVAPVPASPAPRQGTPVFPLVYGIVVREDRATAYLSDATTGQISPYRVGDTVAGGVIEAIEERYVILRLPRGPVRLGLDDPKPVAPEDTPVPRVTVPRPSQ